MIIPALLAAAALAAGEPDGVVATAPAADAALDATAVAPVASVGGAAQVAAPHGLTTDQQIERWIAARDPARRPFDGAQATLDDREPHAAFSVGVGTGGYRDYGAAVSLPIGEHGRLDASFRQVENGYYGAGYRDPWFDDSGYALPGRPVPGAALDYEYRLARPGGPPQWTGGREPKPERTAP